MASQTVSLVAVSENAAKKIALGSGGKIKVQAGTKYLLQTENSQVAPENITVKRIGKDLLVSFEGSEKPDVTLQGFFADGMDSHLYGVSEDGQLHAYVRTDGEGFYGPLLIADGESAPIALGGDGVAYNVALVGETDDSSGFILWPLLLGLAGVGAAAAIIHHNRDDGHKTHTSPAPTNIKVMDDVGPIQGQLSSGDITDDAHPEISGNGVPGAIIHLFDNGQEIGSTTVAPDGTWTLTPELADGEHSFDATQVVPGQKPSAPVDVIDLIVDTLAPAKPTIEQVLDAVGSIQGPIANGGVTDDPAPTLSGKAEAGSTVTLYDNGEEMGSVVADGNGQWSYTPATPLSEGEHLFTVDATDKAGNTSEPSDVFSIITDYTSPVATLTIDVVAGDDIVNLFESKAQQLISGKAGGEFLPGDLVTFTLNGTTYSAAVNAAGDWKVAVAGADLAEDSSIHATLVAHDAAGNSTSVVADHAYSVDLDPPLATLAIDVVAGDDVVNLFESRVPQLISGKVGGEFMPGDLVIFTLNGTAYSAAVNASGEWKVTVAGADLARDTSIQATLVAHDAAGNSASVVADHPYSVDLDPPVATLTIDVVAGDDILNLAESKTSQIISGKAGGEFLAGDIVSFTLNGHAYSAAVSGSGDWSVSVAGSDLAKETGIHATLVARDAAGNSASVVADHAYMIAVDPGTTTLTIDTVAGDDIVNLVESQASQPISGKVVGTYLAGDQVTFNLNGHAYSAAVGADGKWSVAVPGSDLVGDSAHQINATVIGHDLAGNANTATVSHAYSVDVTPPVATLSIDSVTSDNTITSSEAAGNVTISGKVSGEFTANDQVSFQLDGTTYSTTVTANGDWSVSVPGSKLVAESGHKIDASLVAHDAAGNVATISASHPYLVQLNSVSITSMSKDSGIDLDHVSDFITADGSAGRGVYGTLTQVLTGDQKVQISTDAGATWKDALTSGLNWVAVDTSSHAANWTIQARIVENGVAQGEAASKAVIFLGVAGGAPSITNIPGADTLYTTAKTADGSDVHVSLAGTNARAGDTLHIVWGDTSYDQVLTAADITSGAVLAKVPAQQTTTQGGQWDFAVTAQIVTVEGQISAPSSAVQIHGEGWTTLAIDDLNRDLITMGGQSVYQGGGVTITSDTTLHHRVQGGTGNAGLVLDNSSVGNTSHYAQISFTQALESFSVNISALQNKYGGSRVVVYDTQGEVLSDSHALSDGTGGTSESTLYSYAAPLGRDIGMVMIYGDGTDGGGGAGGIVLDTLQFKQTQHAPGFNDTFTNEVGMTGTFHSEEGHFTVAPTGTVSIRSADEHNLDGAYMYIGSGTSAIGDSSASFIFDQAVQSISYSLWGLETQQSIPGNYSKLEVYDTNGALIFTRNVVNNGGSTYNYEQVSYTAPEGLGIGKAIVYQDQNACLLDNFTSVLAPSAPSGQKLIDHDWETYFDEVSVTKGVIWQGQSFATGAFSGGTTLEGYHSDAGGFIVNGSAAKEAAASNLWANATSGSMYVADAATAVVTFDSARSKVELGVTGIEITAGNHAVLNIYDTGGNLLETIRMSNPSGTYDIQSFSYDAHSNMIGSIEIIGDSGGTHITSISSSVTQVTADSDVISMAVDPMTYFAQESAHIFGSAGLDTLKLTGANQVLDLTQLTGDNGQAKISSIEKFDITGTGNNTLKLSLNDVLHLGETDMFRKDGKVQVMVDGDAGDKVELHGLHDHGSFSGTWQSTGTADIGGVTYHVYNYSQLDAEVLIKEAMTASIV
ncbi:Ig-like domain-containing protein [Pseudomonas pseudonitroreducens]|uniref:Ig-like domain-containing protein n=1 Tax=Pseudomonas pseudonitroreducens TaxID=2892326 RepID=UPI001F41EE84|nr:Ig-like domain-containing protein [Pseudomonas pseudonitroreducens]